MTTTNEEIKKNLVDALYWDSRIDASQIEVYIENGTVILEGTVPTYGARKAAQQDTAEIAGVKAIDNRLRVKYPNTFTFPTDEEIKANIKNVLLWNQQVNAEDIKVKVNNSFVTLEGSVDTFWKKLRVESLASDVNGVLNVTNKLTVVPGKDFVDEAIAKDIVNAIDRSLKVNVDNIDIRVEKGKVTISGTVPNWSAYWATYDAVQYTAGVTDIEDRLVVE